LAKCHSFINYGKIIMKNNKSLSALNTYSFTRRAIALSALISMVGCASTSGPTYLPAPSANKSSSDYKRAQIESPVKKQMISAAITGFIGGALGPLGSIFTNVVSKYSQKKIITGYWKSFSNTELVGVVIEDATQQRLLEYKNKAELFTQLPNEAMMPKHYSVDFGAGNLFILPVKNGIHPQVGDVVTAYVAPDAWKIVDEKVNFEYIPTIIDIRCSASNQACINAPENEQGIAKHLGLVSEI